MTAAATAELAAEKELAFDQAVDFTVERSRGKSVDEVDAVLSDELRRRGVAHVDTTGVAEQIVAALAPSELARAGLTEPGRRSAAAG